jgi:hypothetical protein
LSSLRREERFFSLAALVFAAEAAGVESAACFGCSAAAWAGRAELWMELGEGTAVVSFAFT